MAEINFNDKAGLTYVLAKIHTWLTNNMVRKEEGKGLSTNDYTNDDLNKLSNIEAEANKYVLPKATETSLGGVMIGENIEIDADGKISAKEGTKNYNDLTNKPSIGGVELTGDKDLSQFGIQEQLVFNTLYDKDTNKVATMKDVNASISSVYHYKGSINFVNIPTITNVSGDVYNIKDEFTADERFVEDARGKTFPAGTNIAYTEEKLWDVLSGAIDLSKYVTLDDLVPITTQEIDAMFSDWT